MELQTFAALAPALVAFVDLEFAVAELTAAEFANLDFANLTLALAAFADFLLSAIPHLYFAAPHQSQPD